MNRNEWDPAQSDDVMGYEKVAPRSNNTNCHLCWGATENRKDPILINIPTERLRGFRVILERAQEEVTDKETHP